MEAIFRMPYGLQVECEFDDSTTVNEAIAAFVDEGLLVDLEPYNYYVIAINGGGRARGDQTLVSAGVDDGSIIEVLAVYIGSQ